MGKSGGSTSVKMPRSQKELYRFTGDVLRDVYWGWRAERSQPFFGLDVPNLGPDVLDYASRSAALRTFGGPAYRDVLGAVKATATGAPEDISQYLDAIERNEWARFGTDVKETMGSKVGTSLSSAVASELTTGRTQLAAKYGLMKAQFRMQALDTALKAAQLYGQLGAAQVETLSRAGMAFRQANQYAFERAYQDVLTRKYQLPLQMAGTAAGAAGAFQYYADRTPASNPWAGALSGAMSGAMVGADMGKYGGPWGAAIGAVLGALAYS